MRIELTGRHVAVTPTLRRMVERKLARLARILSDSAVSAQIVLARDKGGVHADITVHARGDKFLHGAGATAPTCAQSMTRAADKIARQAGRVKGKWQQRKRQAAKPAARRRTAPATD